MLFAKYALNALPLKNRIVMPPMTRSRAGAGDVATDMMATYLAAASVLNESGIAYIHIAEADREDAPVMSAAFKEALRIIFHGTLIYSGKYTKARAEEALANGWADLIGFGRPFIANPDLPHRLENDLPLNAPSKRNSLAVVKMDIWIIRFSEFVFCQCVVIATCRTFVRIFLCRIWIVPATALLYI